MHARLTALAVALLAVAPAAATARVIDPPREYRIAAKDIEREARPIVARWNLGPRLGAAALPFSPDVRGYRAEHRDGLATITLDARGRLTSRRVVPRTGLPPDPAAGYELRNRVRLPLLGTWWVMWGGPDVRRNYHAVERDQRHAYDLIRWRGGATYRGDGTRNADYHAWNRRVVAPAAGTVVAAVDGIADNAPPEMNASQPAGNHVLLDLGEGEYALLGHLREGTVRVRPGDRVRDGQPLGRVGNSGNSSEPHLHFHVQDTPVLFSGTGLPVPLGEQGDFVRR